MRRRRAWLRATLAVAVCALAIDIPAVAAKAADDACAGASQQHPSAACVRVLVTDANGTLDEYELSASQIASRAGSPFSVAIRSDGQTSARESDSLPGVSIADILQRWVPATHFVTITRADRGYDSLLDETDKHDLSAPQFNDGLPAIRVDGQQQLEYIRPLRAGEPNDYNAPDDVIVAAMGEIQITAHTEGHILRPTIGTKDGAQPQAGAKTTFMSTVPNAPTDQNGTPAPLDYDWDFNDPGSSGDTQTTDVPWAPHSYSKIDATYYPSVIVTGGDSYGRAQTVVTIGEPADPGQGEGHGGGDGPPSNPPNGPKRGSGTKSGGSVRQAPGSGNQPGTGAGTASPIGPGGDGNGASGSAAPSSGAPSTGRRGGTSNVAAGVLVNGQVLVAPPGAVVAAGPSEDPGQASAPSARRPPRESLDLRWLWWLVPIALVGAGVYSERRRPHAIGKTP